MAFQIYGIFHFLTFFIFLFFSKSGVAASALHSNTTSNKHSVNSNSVLVALLDSQYTELSELVEKAILLQTLEEAVSKHNITIFAPRNEALERDLDPEFKRYLLEPGNLKSLQHLLLFHMIPRRIDSSKWPQQNQQSIHHNTLCNRQAINEILKISHRNGDKHVSGHKITRPDDVIRPDGIIHGIERVLIPKSVQQDFNSRRSLRSISAVIPQGAPEVDPRTHKLKKSANPAPVGSPPALSICSAMAPGPSLAPAPAPGPGGPHHHFNGEAQVKDFIETLLHYGGYNELADILVNLTSLASDMGRLVSEGYKITVLAPNDEAMAKLTTEQLSEPRAPEQIVYYHIIPEYQTEESMYNAVRRFGKVKYDTLRSPLKVTAEEADGSVKFGQGESTYLFDPDIYTDGRISVQGIDGVMFPPEEKKTKVESKAADSVSKVAAQPRRGKLLEVACRMLGVIGHDSHFTTCH